MTSSHITLWLSFLAAGDLSAGTLALRCSYISSLERFLGALLPASEQQLAAWLNNPRWGTESRRSALATVRSFYGWASRHQLIDCNPAEHLARVRPKQRIPRPIPERELKIALMAATREQEFMLLLGAYAGLRRAEIAGVHGHHVTGLGLLVRGKGDQERRVPIHPRLEPHLRGLRGWAFPSTRRPGEHMGGTYVRDRLGEVLPDPWTPHSLRHRFATQTYRGCKDITVVQQLLGHQKVETTLLYVLVEHDALTSAVNAVA